MKFLVLAACVAVSSAQHLVAYPNGAVVPVDTFEVQAAKAAHAAAGGAILPVGYHGYPLAYHGYAHGFGGLVAHANGAVVPVDTPDVHAAKLAHAAAGGAIHASEVYGHAYHAGFPYAAGYAYAGYPYAGVPVHPGFLGLVAHPNGAVVPAEPADLVAARAEHLAAHAAA